MASVVCGAVLRISNMKIGQMNCDPEIFVSFQAPNLDLKSSKCYRHPIERN